MGLVTSSGLLRLRLRMVCGNSLSRTYSPTGICPLHARAPRVQESRVKSAVHSSKVGSGVTVTPSLDHRETRPQEGDARGPGLGAVLSTTPFPAHHPAPGVVGN